MVKSEVLSGIALLRALYSIKSAYMEGGIIKMYMHSTLIVIIYSYKAVLT